MAAIAAFKEPHMIARLMDDSLFTDWDARRVRYAVYWAFYENTAYRAVQRWAAAYKTTYGLYKYTRGIYNPAYRLGEFWKAHLFGGLLDPMAGDGKMESSAIPIIVPEENKAGEKQIRMALAALWKASNWQLKKDLLTLWGSILGDVLLSVVDDTAARKVYLTIVHPAKVKEIELDAFGNVKGYTMEYDRPNPENLTQLALYTEQVGRSEEGAVVYRTYRNGAPYAWDEDQGEEWEEGYGFIPMVMVKHNDVGLSFGWSELHAIRGKVHEVDDLASKLDDYIRKTVDPVWLFAGVKPADEKKIPKPTPTSDAPEIGRDELPALYGPVGADAKALVANLDISQVSGQIKSVLEEIERDHPELQMDIWSVSGATSGRALRTARQRAETKVNERRPNYDDALVRAQMMAMTIGGLREYDGYAGINEASYADGKLTHYVSKRPVFSVDPLDDLEIEKVFWETAKLAKDAGMPLAEYLRRKGWSEADVKKIEGDAETQARLQILGEAAKVAGAQAQGKAGDEEKAVEEEAAGGGAD